MVAATDGEEEVAAMRLLSRRAGVLWLVGVASIGLGVPGPSPASAGSPAAAVGEAVIDRDAIDAVIARMHPTKQPTAEQRTQLEATVLEQLIDESLLRQSLGARVQVTEEEVNAAVATVTRQITSRGQNFEAFLAQSGRTEAVFRDQVMLEVALEKLVGPQVTPQAVSRYFTDHRRDYDGTKLRVSHIILRPDIVDVDGVARRMEQAEAIRRDVLRGDVTFEEAAMKHSAGPSRARGGDIGWITRTGPMVDAFTAGVFNLAKGEVSKPFITPFGVHVAKVTDVEAGRVGLDVVRSKIEKELASQAVRSLVNEARQAIPVKYAPGMPHFDPATPAGAGTRRVIVVGEPATSGAN